MPLTQMQLFEIAECKKKSLLIDWLRENRIKYTFTRKGHVVTTMEQFNRALEMTEVEVISFDGPE